MNIYKHLFIAFFVIMAITRTDFRPGSPVFAGDNLSLYTGQETSASGSSAASGDNSKKISDDDFLDIINSIEETENLIKTYKPAKPDTFRFDSDYYTSNRKPGYLLFSGDDYDYKMHGYSSKLTCNLFSNFSIDTGYKKNFIFDDGSDSVDLQQIDLAFRGRVGSGNSISGKVKNINLSSGRQLNEFGMDYSSSFGPYVLGVAASRDVYASGRTSFDNPAEYYRMAVRGGYEMSKDMYLEVQPAFESYFNDGNRKKEFIATMIYVPPELPKMTANVFYRRYGFGKEVDDSGYSFVYFAPSTSLNYGFELDYSVPVMKSLDFDFGASVEKEKYEYQNNLTGYYVASASAGMNARFNKHSRLNFVYNFSVSQTENFPCTQNLRLNLRVNF